MAVDVCYTRMFNKIDSNNYTVSIYYTKFYKFKIIEYFVCFK